MFPVRLTYSNITFTHIQIQTLSLGVGNTENFCNNSIPSKYKASIRYNTDTDTFFILHTAGVPNIVMLFTTVS